MRGSWSIEFPSIQSTNKSIYYLYSNPSTIFFNLHIVHPLIHDQGGALGLLTDLGQPSNVLALTGSLLGESFEGFFASLPEN